MGNTEVIHVNEFRKMKRKTVNSSNINTMKFNLKMNKIEFKSEFFFVPGRKFKADIFIPSINCLIEYEGLVFGKNQEGTTGKSGHTTAAGYSSNCEKYNMATLLGFKLLRYTAMNYKNMMDDVRQLIKSWPPDGI
jgi:hypothetical protein